MGFRFRKSFKIGPGIKLNLGKSGLGMSAGIKGLRTGINSKGKTYTSAGVPGTGMSYVNYSSNSKNNKKRRNSGSLYILSVLIIIPFLIIVPQIGIFLILILVGYSLFRFTQKGSHEKDLSDNKQSVKGEDILPS